MNEEYCTNSVVYEMFKHLRREHQWTKRRLFEYFKFSATRSVLDEWWAALAGEEP